ncbi:MAG TPA: amidohydrolase family protein, partial [Opitutaceae bacterium]|nr:amidohydrolase family protein [Opitutaceae bacterium]
YYVVSSEREVDAKWSLFMAAHPGLVKVYLECSERFGREDTLCHQRTGLDPKLVPYLVKRAHRAGLRVAAHVLTRFDFATAVAAGVDEVAHVPGWFLVEPGLAGRATLTEHDARLAKARRAMVVTTTVAADAHDLFRGRSMKEVEEAIERLAPGPQGEAGGHRAGTHRPSSGKGDDPHADAAHHAGQDQRWPKGAGPAAERAVQIANLKLLKRHGIPILIGSDHGETSLPEAMRLHQLGVFSPLELLSMWCDTTPRAIFPLRKIGKLQDGYEANFLVLEGDPIADFTNVTKIRMRIKGGQLIGFPDAHPPGVQRLH